MVVGVFDPISLTVRSELYSDSDDCSSSLGTIVSMRERDSGITVTDDVLTAYGDLEEYLSRVIKVLT